MATRAHAAALDRVARAAGAVPGLRLLLLHGSRARGDAHPGSDWDFAYLGEAGLDVAALAAAIGEALGADEVDLADLARAGGVLRHRVAQDGTLVHESSAGEHERFWTEAVRFWCDAEPVIRAGVKDVLEGLGP